MQRPVRLLLGFVLLALAFSSLSAPPASAAGVVGSGSPGTCTEAALNTALTGGGLVTFNCGVNPHTITVTVTKVIAVATRVEGGNLVTLSGGSIRRIFSVSSGAALELHELTLASGSALTGGAITTQGTLSITHSTLTSNSASKHGGAIYNNGGTVTISDSTLSANHVPTGNTSGVYGNGGAIYNASGTLAITRSTFSGNYGSRGGGIFSISSSNIGPIALAISESTFSGNSADTGGGIELSSGGPVSILASTIAYNSATFMDSGGGIAAFVPVTVANSIVAHNGTGADCTGSVTSNGYNLSSDASCSFTQPTDNPATDPLLTTLVDNGGPTLTHLPLPGSVAIDGGPSSCSSTDQRGILRPQGTACEIGAVEVNAAPVVVAPTYALPATRLGAATVPVRVTWSASDPDITRHRLQRSENGGAFTADGTFTTTVTTKSVDRQLVPGSRYRFKAYVTDGDGMTGVATGASVLVQARQETVVCSSTVAINCLIYTAGWTQRGEADAFGGQVRSAGVGSSRATFAFFGTNVGWATTTGPGMGKAEVWVDATKVRTIDLYAATTTTRKIVFVKNGLSNTSHSIEIRVLGTKNTLSSGTRVDIDAFVTLRP